MKMYTTEEVANILRLHIKTVEKKTRENEIKGVKVGKRWLISEEEVKRLEREGV